MLKLERKWLKNHLKDNRKCDGTCKNYSLFQILKYRLIAMKNKFIVIEFLNPIKDAITVITTNIKLNILS